MIVLIIKVEWLETTNYNLANFLEVGALSSKNASLNISQYA